MAKHRASCQCGSLVAEAENDPEIVIACSCTACRKRTGSPFGAGGYFLKEHVAISGEERTFTRTAHSGRWLTNHFCPSCGTTLYWTMEMRPGHAAVALGAFDTPPPVPTRSVWTEQKFDWVHFPDDWDIYPQGSPRPA